MFLKTLRSLSLIVLLLPCPAAGDAECAREQQQVIDGDAENEAEAVDVRLLQTQLKVAKGALRANATDTQAAWQVPTVPGYESSDDIFIPEYPYEGKISFWDMYPPFMIGATWGTGRCNGVSDTSADWAYNNGCSAVMADTDGDCIGDGPLTTRTLPVQNMQGIAGAGSAWGPPPQWPLSAVAVKFSWQIQQGSLQWSDFEMTMSDGSTVQPTMLNVMPDNDQNEIFTVTLWGNFGSNTYGQGGDWSTGSISEPYMTEIKVVDDLTVTNGTHTFNVNGASFKGGNLDIRKGPVLAMALARSYDQSVNPFTEGNGPCGASFPSTTHVVTAQTMGGVTYDGVNNFSPSQTGLFDIVLNNGELLRRSAYLGLGDLDGDDFTDICLDVSEAEFESFAGLIMQCDSSDPCKWFALPRGNKDGFGTCVETQPQPIVRVRCPEAAVCR